MINLLLLRRLQLELRDHLLFRRWKTRENGSEIDACVFSPWAFISIRSSSKLDRTRTTWEIRRNLFLSLSPSRSFSFSVLSNVKRECEKEEILFIYWSSSLWRTCYEEEEEQKKEQNFNQDRRERLTSWWSENLVSKQIDSIFYCSLWDLIIEDLLKDSLIIFFASIPNRIDRIKQRHWKKSCRSTSCPIILIDLVQNQKKTFFSHLLANTCRHFLTFSSQRTRTAMNDIDWRSGNTLSKRKKRKLSFIDHRINIFLKISLSVELSEKHQSMTYEHRDKWINKQNAILRRCCYYCRCCHSWRDESIEKNRSLTSFLPKITRVFQG